MKILIVNGGPRKNWNTATLLKKAQEGAVSKGAETELIHLYDLNFKGCKSCFACKKVGGKSYGRCATRDDLTPILDRVKDFDAIIMGSPVYLGTATGETRSFFERLVFPFLVYDGKSTLFPKKINTGCIYTMNMTEEDVKAGRHGFNGQIASTERYLRRMFGASETMLCTDTYQFTDYSKVVAPMFDEAGKRQRRQEVFPLDCQKAFDMGARFASGFQPNPPKP